MSTDATLIEKLQST